MIIRKFAPSVVAVIGACVACVAAIPSEGRGHLLQSILSNLQAEGTTQPLTAAAVPSLPDLSFLNVPAQEHCTKPLPTLQPCTANTQPPFTRQSRIAVVGAGPAGISTVHMLTGLGYENVRVFERTGRVGGYATTKFVNGVPHEMGPCCTIGRYGCVVELIKQHNLTLVPIPDEGGYVVEGKNGGLGEPAANWKVHYWAKITGQNADPAAFQSAVLEALQRYRTLYSEIFGDNDFLFPDRPSPQQLAKLGNGSFKDFLIQNRLEALIPALFFMQTAQGYGFLEEVPPYYGLLWSTPSLFKSLIIEQGSNPNTSFSMILEGFETLFKRVADPFKPKILLNAQISSIKRDSQGVQITYTDPSNPDSVSEKFDFVILTSKFPETLDIIDARPDEKDVFGRLKSSKLYTRTISAQGLPVGIKGCMTYYGENMTNSPKSDPGFFFLRNERGIFYPNSTEPNPIYITGQQTGFGFSDQISDSQVDATLISEISEQGGSNITILDRLSADYFPRFTVQEIQQEYPWKIWDMQGKYRTWYAGSFASFESVADVMDYAFKLIETNLCVPRE